MSLKSVFLLSGRNLDDWLSPILVKELRQGMRARAFLIAFLLLQVFLVLLVVGNVAAQEDRNALDFQNHFFWVIIGFVLLALVPLRGLVAVSHEIKNHTMETIMLTRLTAWRVVVGKWSALFAQSVLLVSAVLPYVILRYFLGGDDVVSDFEAILLMLWLSGILIAASIAVSALGNAVIRIAILVAIVVGVSGGSDSFLSGTWSNGGWETCGWLMIFGFFVPALLFELTASGIAPASENHAIRRRALALSFFISACLLGWLAKTSFQPGIVIPLLVLIGICYFDLSEKPRLLSRMVQSLVGNNPLGRIAALFFLPGWPSALLFSLVVIPFSIGLCFYFVPPDAGFGWLLPVFAVFGSVLLPIFICHLLWCRMKQVLLMVVLYNILLMGLTAVLDGFANLTHSGINGILDILPGIPVLLTESEPDRFKDDLVWYLLGNGCCLVFVTVMLFLGSRSYYRELFGMIRFAKDSTTLPAPAIGEGTT